VPEASIFGLEACQKLIDRQVGCAIGVAMGPTFCGVTGSSVACRWDITGPPAVRAARLMQYALANEVEVAVDESVYNVSIASGRLEVLDSSVMLKGSPRPVTVYSLSEATEQSAFFLLETVYGNVHNQVAHKIKDFISRRSRSVVIVKGIPLSGSSIRYQTSSLANNMHCLTHPTTVYSGKKIVCQRAAGFADLVPFLHVADQTKGLLQLAETIAIWFRYCDVDDVRSLAENVINRMRKGHWACAHDECIELINLALEEGLEACFVVDQVQFLDAFSLSLLRECLSVRRGFRRGHSRSSTSSSVSLDGEECLVEEKGKIAFLGVHVALYSWKTAEEVATDIMRSNRNLRIPIFEIAEADSEELRNLFRDLSDMECEDRWLDVYCESSGYCAGYFVERASTCRILSSKLWSEGKPVLAETSEDLFLSIPPGSVRKSRIFPVTQVSADVAMRFNQIYDELPPQFQMITKILAVATKNGLLKLPRYIMWEVLNDFVAEGVESSALDIILGEMKEMFLIRIEDEHEEVLSFRTPALADIALDVCTPVQLSAIRIALIERLEPNQATNFRIPLLMAVLHHELGHNKEVRKPFWLKSYDAFRAEAEKWTTRESGKWKEMIEDEIRAAGDDVAEVVGPDNCATTLSIRSVAFILPLLKIYMAPVAFGPMGHTLNVITRNIFHEWRNFHGAEQDAIEKLNASSTSAADRYLREMGIIEEFLGTYQLSASPDVLQKERETITFLASPAVSDADVEKKAHLFFDEFVPQFIETRIRRLHTLVEELKMETTPVFIANGQKPIRKAYEVLINQKMSSGQLCRQDRAQHALMMLGMLNWKPKPVPEFLPISYYQTVARLRNKTLKRLSAAEILVFRHQQSVKDLEAFLVVTPLLYEAQNRGQC